MRSPRTADSRTQSTSRRNRWVRLIGWGVVLAPGIFFLFPDSRAMVYRWQVDGSISEHRASTKPRLFRRSGKEGSGERWIRTSELENTLRWGSKILVLGVGDRDLRKETDAGLVNLFLNAYPKVRIRMFYRCEISTTAAKRLRTDTVCEALTFRNCKMSSDAFRILSGHPSLKELQWENEAIDGNEFEGFEMPQLDRLTLKSDTLKRLPITPSQFPSLTTLMVHGIEMNEGLQSDFLSFPNTWKISLFPKAHDPDYLRLWLNQKSAYAKLEAENKIYRSLLKKEIEFLRKQRPNLLIELGNEAAGGEPKSGND